MNLTATSTSKVVKVNGVPARIWEAETEHGTRCHLFVPLIEVPGSEYQGEFDELEEHAAPSAEVEAIPLRLII
jgi:hypothetical protein